jgi:hypothetical protein
MQDNSSLHSSRKSSKDFVRRGFANGMIAGFISAEIYIILIAILSLEGDPKAAIVILFFGQIYGLLPGAIVGALSGALIGRVFFLIQTRLSTSKGSLFGLLIATLIVIVIALILGLPDDVIGVIFWLPIIALYLGSGEWVGKKLTHGLSDSRQSPANGVAAPQRRSWRGWIACSAC